MASVLESNVSVGGKKQGNMIHAEFNSEKMLLRCLMAGLKEESEMSFKDRLSARMRNQSLRGD